MTNQFDRIIQRRDSDSIKWRLFDEDVLPLWVADMDFRSPEPVIEALTRRVAHGVFGYGEEPQELKDLLVERLARLYDWQVTPEEILFVPGVITGFNWALQALQSPGAAAAVQTPVYPPFLSAPRNAGMQRLDLPLVYGPGGRAEIDFDAFEAGVSGAGVRAFILCNPHNPVGRSWSRAELERLAEICLRHQILMISDEIHCDLIFSESRHTPLASLAPEVSQQVITLMAPSKTFNIAGLDCSFAVVQNEDLRKLLNQSRLGLVKSPNILGFTAALAAYRYADGWLTDLGDYLQANRDYLVEFIRTDLPQIAVAPPEATYLAWLDCRRLNLPVLPGEFFLRNARVALNEGKDFGQGGEGFVRLNFGCPRSVLQEALERMRGSLEDRAR